MGFHITINDLLAINASRSPDKVALIDPEKGISLRYAEMKMQVLALSNFLTFNNIRTGDRIAFFLKDSIEFLLSLFGTVQTGAIFVPINFRVSADELRYIIEDSQPRILIFDRDGREIVEKIKDRGSSIQEYIYTGIDKLDFAKSFSEVIASNVAENTKVSVSEENVACILYTSGTTGRPKGVVHTHRSFLANGRAWTHAAKISPVDRSIALGPLYHVGGMLAAFLPNFYMGGSFVIQNQFDPIKVLRWIKEFKITIMWATPTHINMMISRKEARENDLSSLRVIQYSGAPIHMGLLSKVREVFGKIDLINAYGMTENASLTCVYPEEHDFHLGSVGRALPETFVRLVKPGEADPNKQVEKGEVGEIIAKSPCLMKEYYNMPDKTNNVIKDGWYFTGDLGKMDEDGYLSFVEREDDMIISGAENIYPLEVENILSRHEKVRSVAVIGMPDEEWGEIVAAFIVKEDETLTEQGLDQFCLNSDNLSRFKRPRKYIFVKELPTTSSGKVDKKTLRQRKSL
jgi:long-chain acyl-CoA synthetase